MARIHFNISAALLRWRNRGRVSQSRFRMMNLAALQDMPRGPGWFDSSWDLDHGLEVEVALPGDPPFQAWIEAQAWASAPVTHRPSPHISEQNTLEFEPVDCKAWAPPNTPVDRLPTPVPPGLEMSEMKLELETAELELELV
jgi:hypothetical protein